VAEPFRGVVNLDIRESVPDWAPYEQPKAPAGTPNVLYIVLHDVGFGALSCYGGMLDTLNIDRIAAAGLRTASGTPRRCVPRPGPACRAVEEGTRRGRTVRPPAAATAIGAAIGAAGGAALHKKLGKGIGEAAGQTIPIGGAGLVVAYPRQRPSGSNPRDPGSAKGRRASRGPPREALKGALADAQKEAGSAGSKTLTDHQDRRRRIRQGGRTPGRQLQDAGGARRRGVHLTGPSRPWRC